MSIITKPYSFGYKRGYCPYCSKKCPGKKCHPRCLGKAVDKAVIDICKKPVWSWLNKSKLKPITEAQASLEKQVDKIMKDYEKAKRNKKQKGGNKMKLNNKGFAVGLLFIWGVGTFMLFTGVAEWDKQQKAKEVKEPVKSEETVS